MRFAGNFHPEWGYLAPAPNFMRTARVVVVATAIGATAGAAVVLSLAERSAPGAVTDAGKTLVVVHSLVQPAEAAAPATAPVATTTPAPVIAPVATAVPAAPVAPAAPARVQASIQPQSIQPILPAAAPVTRQPSAPPVTAGAQPIAPPPAPSELARGVDFGGAGERCGAVGEPAGDRGVAAAGEQRRGRFARSVGAAKGRDQKARRDRPAAAATARNRPSPPRRKRSRKSAASGPCCAGCSARTKREIAGRM